MDEPRYPVSVEFPIAWGDMDAFGHVNNTVFFRLFESGRIAYFRAVGVPTEVAHAKVGPILASTKCDFLRPLTYPDTVRVDTGVSRLGGKSFTMVYRIHSAAQDALVGSGEGVIVWYDYVQGRSAPIPEDLRARIEALQSP